MADICVAVTAWPRTTDRVRYLTQTLKALRRNLTASGLKIRWLCSSESARIPAAARRQQETACDDAGFELLYHPRSPRLGRHVNWMVKQIRAAYVFYVQDDWVLTEPLDLAGCVAFFETYTEYQYVRYCRWLYAHVPGDALTDHFVALASDIADRFSHQPYMARRSFYDTVGPFDDEALTNEAIMNERVKALGLPVAVRVPFVFQHIGRTSSMPDRYVGRLPRKLTLDRFAPRYDASARMSNAALSMVRQLLIKYLPGRMLELGPGLSSFLLGKYAVHQPVHHAPRYVIIDQRGRYADAFVTHMAEFPSVYSAADIHVVPQLPGGFYDVADLYETSVLGCDEKFDLVLWDGPSGGKARGTSEACEFARRHIGANTIVVLDDAQRPAVTALQKVIEGVGKFSSQVVNDPPPGRRRTVALVPVGTRAAVVPKSN